MLALSDFPYELITAIFKKLDHIDDAFNLANCCKSFKAQLATHQAMMKVMRAILDNSPAHETDLLLFRLIKGISVSSPESGTNLESFLNCYKFDVDQLNDDVVLAIVRLRQRIRQIYDLYLNPSIQDQYRRSNFPAGTRERSEIFEGKLRTTPNGLVAWTQSISVTRFSDALMAYWVIIEARKLIMKANAQERNADDNPYIKIMASFWCGSGRKPLLQTLDILEVHDFLYGFLIRRVYHRAWAEDLVDEETEPIDKSWARKLQVAASSVNPIDAAVFGFKEEELTNPALWKSLPVDGSELTLLLKEVPAPLRNYEIDTLSVANLLEFNLGSELLRLEAEQRTKGADDRLVEAWALFRREWPQTARGTIFQSLRSSEQFVEELRRRAPEAQSLPALEPCEDPFPACLSRRFLEMWKQTGNSSA